MSFKDFADSYTEKELEGLKTQLQQGEDPVISVRRFRDDEEVNKTRESDLIKKKGTIEDFGWNLAGIRPIHPYFAQFQKYKRHKCPHCNFKCLYYVSVKNHMKYTHLPNHPNSYYDGKMTEKDRLDWAKAIKR